MGYDDRLIISKLSNGFMEVHYTSLYFSVCLKFSIIKKVKEKRTTERWLMNMYILSLA